MSDRGVEQLGIAETGAERGYQNKDESFESQLTEDMGAFYDDFEGWAMYAFEWGKGELLDFDGPDKWQREQMKRVSAKIKKDPLTTIREAISSGHGIGKTAEVAWVILWAMSTRPHLAGVVTANTTMQLTTKTWRELALWHKRLINRHWFKWSATKFWQVDHPETWFVAATPNTEHNSEAFAGLHSKYVLIIYDEASAIPDKIWEVSEGAMTTPRAMWFAYGNPTKNTGRFKQCFDVDRKRWAHNKVDSRTCRMTNKVELQEWVDTYGEDSDFVRVRVRGEFPRVGSEQFMPTDVVDRAMVNEIPFEAHCLEPVLLGVDVARFGDDKTCIAIRQGRKVIDVRKFRGLDTMQTAVKVILAMKEFRTKMVFVDGVGVGAGVVDRLRALGHEVIEVNGGSTPYDEDTYFNKTGEMWGRMREWMTNGAQIPLDHELRSALIGREFSFDEKEKIRMERKKDMKKRGLPSPDEADAIAHTFAEFLGDVQSGSYEPDEDSYEPRAA